MDLLLLTPIDPFAYQIIPDLGLMYVAAGAREAGFSVDIKDCRREHWDLARLAAHLREAKPRVVGVKCFSNEIARVAQMAAVVKRELPESLMIAGGPHPSMDPVRTMQRITDLDYVFVGEAERSIVPFLKWAAGGGCGEPPPEVQGIAFRRGGEIIVRDPAWEENLDSLPFPAWDLMPLDKYPDESFGTFTPAFPTAPMAMSRGCPHRCTFCGAQKIAGDHFRYRSVANVLAEIEMLEERYGARNFAFVDNSFTSNQKRAREFFEALIARPKKTFITFPNGVRAASLTEELLPLMEKAGCRLVGLGVESSSERTLSSMQKDQKSTLIEEKVKLMRRLTPKMKITASVILGYPGETLEDVKNTIRFTVALPAHHVHFCIFIPLPGTPVYEDLVAKGVICPEDCDPEQYTTDRVGASIPGLDVRKLRRLHQYAYIRFYLEPWRLLSMPGQIKSPGHLWAITRRFVKIFN